MSRAIDRIVIHCSDSPNGRRVTADDIDRWHAERGYARNARWQARFNPSLKAIGYQFVIYVNGAIATGRSIDEIGSHCRGYNATSIGICMVGRDKFPLIQWAALKQNVEALMDKFPIAHVVGHRDLNPNKTCPNFDVAKWMAGDRAPLPGNVLVESGK